MGSIIDNKIKIEDMIYEIRGKQVMLDSDLAKIYHIETGALNRQVKRNIERFDEDFCFQLTNFEHEYLKCQIGITKKEKRGGRRTLPYVFTELGVAMLTSVLNSEIAILENKRIIKAFIVMRHYIGNNILNQKYYNDMTIRHDSEIKLLQESFDRLEENKEVNEIYFDGKIYNAYSKVLDIFNEAKYELIIIDRYTDKTILDMIKTLECNVVLITSKNTKLTKTDIEKYNSTYNNLTIIYNDEYHDRYFIIDKDKIYHSGNSVNHIGYRKSSIDVLQDKSIKQTLLEDIEKIISLKNNL